MYFRRTHSVGPVAGLRTKSNSVAKCGLFFWTFLKSSIDIEEQSDGLLPLWGIKFVLLVVASCGWSRFVVADITGTAAWSACLSLNGDKIEDFFPVLLDDLVALEMKVMTGIEILEYRTVERIWTYQFLAYRVWRFVLIIFSSNRYRISSVIGKQNSTFLLWLNLFSF